MMLKNRLRTAVALVAAVSAWMIWAQAAAAAPLLPGQVLAGIGGGTINQFTPTGTLTGTLNTGIGAALDTGMCFDLTGNLLGTNWNGTVTRWDTAGTVLPPNPFLVGSGQIESCALDAAGHIFTGAKGVPLIQEFSQAGGPPIMTFAGSFPGGTGGTDWVDLASDQHTLLIANEGGTIFRFDLASNTQLPDFATGLGECFALRIRPNGEVMVACGSVIYRLDAAGHVIQTYPNPGGGLLFALNLDPDNSTFWTADLFSGAIYHFDIATGALIKTWTSNLNTQLGGLAVVGEIRVAVDTTPPTCLLTNTIAGPPKQIEVTVQDTGSGLGSVVVTNSTNADAPVPPFTAGTRSALTITATKINQSQSASVALTVTDAAGNVTTCDPVFSYARTATVRTGTVRFRHVLPTAGHVLLKPVGGVVASVDLLVNGRPFHVTHLVAGKAVRLQIASALHRGSGNVVIAKVHAQRGARVKITISD